MAFRWASNIQIGVWLEQLPSPEASLAHPLPNWDLFFLPFLLYGRSDMGEIPPFGLLRTAFHKT